MKEGAGGLVAGGILGGGMQSAGPLVSKNWKEA